MNLKYLTAYKLIFALKIQYIQSNKPSNTKSANAAYTYTPKQRSQ